MSVLSDRGATSWIEKWNRWKQDPLVARLCEEQRVLRDKSNRAVTAESLIDLARWTARHPGPDDFLLERNPALDIVKLRQLGYSGNEQPVPLRQWNRWQKRIGALAIRLGERIDEIEGSK